MYEGISFFEGFPEFDGVFIWSNKFIVICLRTKPFDLSYGFTHMNAFQAIKLRLMRLELSIVLEGFRVCELIILLFEENDSSCIITDSKKVSWRVKLDLVDDVLLLYVLKWLLGTKELFLWELEMIWNFRLSHSGRRNIN